MASDNIELTNATIAIQNLLKNFKELQQKTSIIEYSPEKVQKKISVELLKVQVFKPAVDHQEAEVIQQLTSRLELERVCSIITPLLSQNNFVAYLQGKIVEGDPAFESFAELDQLISRDIKNFFLYYSKDPNKLAIILNNEDPAYQLAQQLIVYLQKDFLEEEFQDFINGTKEDIIKHWLDNHFAPNAFAKIYATLLIINNVLAKFNSLLSSIIPDLQKLTLELKKIGARQLERIGQNKENGSIIRSLRVIISLIHLFLLYKALMVLQVFLLTDCLKDYLYFFIKGVVFSSFKIEVNSEINIAQIHNRYRAISSIAQLKENSLLDNIAGHLISILSYGKKDITNAGTELLTIVNVINFIVKIIKQLLHLPLFIDREIKCLAFKVGQEFGKILSRKYFIEGMPTKKDLYFMEHNMTSFISKKQDDEKSFAPAFC